MPDDERTRRRLGDETKARIADLASGWTADPEAGPAAEVPPPPAAPDPPRRQKQKTLPPPPPGSEARKALEDKILDEAAKPAPIAAAAPTNSSSVGGGPSRPNSASVGGAPNKSGPMANPIVPASATAALAGPRTKPPTAPPPARGMAKTAPPPIPPARPKSTTSQSPIIQSANEISGTIGHTGPMPTISDSGSLAAIGTPKPERGTGERIAMPLPANAPAVSPYVPTPPPMNRIDRSPVVDDEPLETLPDSSLLIDEDSKLTVPIGEFDHGSTVLDKDKLRIQHAQSTIKRDAASALLGIAEASLTVVKEVPAEVLLTESAEHGRGDPTSIDPSTSKFERGDPTQLGRTDATQASTPPAGMHTAAGRLRTVAQLRRQRGIFGDVLYVRTWLFGVRQSRQELIDLEEKQAARQQERRRHLVILGRTAVSSDGFDHPALGPAREQMGSVEDERARHRGQVVAADQELQRVTRDRETNSKQYAIDIAAVDAELAELQKRLEPLLKEQIAVQKRGAELRDSLRRVDQQIAETTASMVSVKGQKLDPAGIQAELATLRADRVAVARDEPKIAADLDALNPRIAALEAKRTESQKRRTDLVKQEEDDKRRTEELLTAIGAKRKVMDRAAGDAEVLRDKILFELGERLYVDRPDDLSAQLAPIESIDVELGTSDRRVMELREILSSIDKAKLARGIAVMVLFLAVVGGISAWLIYMLT